MAKRVAGIAYVFVNGVQYPLRGNFTVSPSTVEREMLAGQDRVHGYRESPRVPFISGDITLIPEVTIAALDAMKDEVVTCELAGGHVYTLRRAVTTAAHEINAAEGQVSVTWQGTQMLEIAPS